ncbi:MAG: Gfo/Idh/MocA family oxidoreductase [Ruminococcaceae bacterium]|nr:Gfo/Idh/MocA family oxidoreductase [Oscillospiraceae bacterium]
MSSNNRRLKTAIIGPGKVAHLHAKALQNLAESEFTAVCGRNLTKTGEFARQYGVEAFPDINTMASSGVEAVVICTPHPFHRDYAVQAARAGMHVLVEKPLASTLADCDAMIQAANESNVQLGTISQRRFYRPAQRIRQAIDDGKIGRPILGTVNIYGWRDEAYYRSDPWRGSWEMEGGGVLVNQAPHQLDILQWYMGPVEEVFGFWSNENHPYIEVEDTAVAVLKFRNGGLGSIVVSNSQNPALYGKVCVHGENGASIGVQTDGGQMFIAGVHTEVDPPYNDVWTVPGEEHLLEVWKQEDSNFFRSVDALTYYMERQLEDFLRAIINGKKPLIDGEEGRKTVEIFTAIYRSNRDRTSVRFPLVPEAGNDADGRLL